MLVTSPKSTPAPASRAQRVLAYMAASMILISVIAIAAVLIGAFFGMSGQFDGGVWPIVALLPLIALPIGMILIIALVVVTTRRRSRGAALVDAPPPPRSRKR